jgi:type III pantothenate kinase
MVDGIVERIRAELPGGRTAVCLATGGMASVLSHETSAIQHVEPDLTLHGLRLIWELQANASS